MRKEAAEAFQDGIVKAALGNLAASALTGGAIGALQKGYSDYSAARDRGASVSSSLSEGGKGALYGGAVGGAIGGGLAASSRALRGWHNPVTENTGFFSKLDRTLGDFGKRQFHAVTGYVPAHLRGDANLAARSQYLRGIGVGGRENPQDYVKTLETKLKDIRAGKDTGWLPQGTRELLTRADLWKARVGASANETLMQHGATSLPGLVRAMADPTKRKAVLGATGKDLLSGGGMTAFGLASTIPTMTSAAAGKPLTPEEAGMGRGELIGRAAGDAASWLVPGSVPIVGQMLSSSVLKDVGGAVGRGVDSVRGKLPRVAGPTQDFTHPANTQSALPGHQVEYSSSAAGKPWGGGFE